MANYLNYSIQTRDQMKDWIMKRLGWPLVQVEITDDQLDICIDDAVEEFTQYVMQEEQYIGLNLEEYNTSGFTLANNVASVFALNADSTGQGGHNTLFTVKNQMWNAGMFPFANNGSIGNSGAWIEYELALQYIDMVNEMTGAGFTFEYNERNKLLTLIPNPTKISAKGWACIGTRIIRDDEYQYGESWVKKYALAQAKQIIGTIRAKYEGTQLLGGGQIARDLMDQGLSEQDNLLEVLKEKYVPCNFYVT